MYSIEKISFGPDHLYKMINRNTGDYVQAIPFLGARIHDLQLGGITLIKGAADYEQLKEREGMYEGAKLTPFPGRIAKGTYVHEGNEYCLDLNEPGARNAIHGLVHNQAFEVLETEVGDQGASLSMKLDFAGSDGYPFPFSLLVNYELSGNQLTLSTTITNTSSASIPVGDGWHAYFQLSGSADNWVLHLPACKQLIMDEELIPTGGEVHLEAQKFTIDGLHFDDCFELDHPSNKSSVILEQGSKKLEVWQETGSNGYNYLVLYIPGERDRIAIEPMTCPPNAFNSGKGLIILEPNQTVHLRTGVTLN